MVANNLKPQSASRRAATLVQALELISGKVQGWQEHCRLLMQGLPVDKAEPFQTTIEKYQELIDQAHNAIARYRGEK